MNAMGQMASSLLGLLLTHCPDIKEHVHNLSVLIKKSKRVTFFRLEWQALNVGQPPKGTFDLALRRAVEEVAFRPLVGHPDQVPYSDLERISRGPLFLN